MDIKFFFKLTRPKRAFGQQGLDWIVRPEYRFGLFSMYPKISPHDKFSSTNIIHDIRDKYELCLCIGHSHFAGLRERPMENAGEAVVQDGEDEEGIVQQGQHNLAHSCTIFPCYLGMKI